MKRIIFFALVLCMHYSSHAQKLKDLISYDTITYVYKLNPEQSKLIISSGRIPDTNFLFTRKFKEYPRTKFFDDTLPNGHFIIANINDHTVNYRSVIRTPFYVASKVLPQEVIIYVSDKKSRQLITEAKMEVNGMVVPYDSSRGGYCIVKKKINPADQANGRVFLTIAYHEEEYTFHFQVNENAETPSADPYAEYAGQVLNSPGYLLLDKPMYKPLDTLRMKSFLVDFISGKPVHKRVKLSISESTQNFTYKKTLRYNTAGAYLFKWPIPDTLKTDRLFYVNLRYSKRGKTMVQNGSFKLEEYELNKNTYDVNMPEDIFYAGDDIFFYAMARDMNGFPVQGTRVHYTLRLGDVQSLLTDTLLVSQAKRDNWFEADTTIENDNMIRCVIPSNVFAKANARYYLDIVLTDPVSFEKKSFAKTFYKYAQTEKLLVYQVEDSVHVRCLYNGKDTAVAYYFYTLRGTDTIQKKKVTTPFTYQLQPLETKVGVVAQNKKITEINIQYNKLSMVHIRGRRSADSIQIQFDYPFPEPIHYRIYKKDKLMKAGASSTLRFTLPDASKDEWRIQFTMNLQQGIENNFYEMTFVPEKHRLHVIKSIPAQAFPGDSLAVDLKVLNYKNRPVKKINVAAYALNSAFEDNIQRPYIMVPEEYENRIKLVPLAASGYASLIQPVYNVHYELKNDHFVRFDLKKNEYYQFLYPEHEYEWLSYSKQQKQPEFAIFVHHKHNLVTPKYILFDGQPIFISDVNRKTTYSMAAATGKHEIAFRYFNRLYTLKNVLFESNKKYVLGVNIDSIKAKQSAFLISDSLAVLAPEENEKQQLYPTLLVTNVFSSDSMEILSDNWNEHKKYNTTYLRPETMNIDGDMYYIQGPYKPNAMIAMKVNNKVFTLKSHVENTYHYDQIIQEFVPKNNGKPKGEFLPFMERTVGVHEVNSLLKPDTVVPQPIQTTLQHNDEVRVIQEKLAKEEENFYQNYHSQQSGMRFNLWIENNLDTCYVKSLWIVSKTKFESSEFIQSVPRQVYSINKYLPEEKYDLYFFLNKNRIFMMKDYQFKANDVFYLNPALIRKEEFLKSQIEIPLKIYAELNSVPLLSFHDQPWLSKEKIVKKEGSRNNLYFHGMITDESQQPLSGALVYVELNGVYKYGAMTNPNGLFEITDMLPAAYQVKIYHPDFKVSHIPSYFMEDRLEYELISTLMPREITAPSFEIVTNDFRFMAFTQHERENYLSILLHEKENREMLKGALITLSDDSGFVRKYPLDDHQLQLLFPENENKDYTLEISKPGYTSLILRHVFFRNLYHYHFEIFLGLEKKEILKKKEYNVNLDQVKPLEREEETTSSNVIIYDQGLGEVGEIYGRVLNDRNEPLDYASVQALEGYIVKGGKMTDLNGYFRIKPLSAGTYTLKVTYAGYSPVIIKGIDVFANNRKMVNIVMTPGSQEGKVVTVKSKKLIDPDRVSRVITKEQLSNMPTVNTGDMLSTMNAAPTYYSSGSTTINIAGDRSDGTMYMIDGMMVRGTRNLNLPAGYLESSEVGISAKYANATSNISVYSTEPSYVNDTLIQQVIQNKNISAIRKTFSDVGFWKPNMITNKSGVVSFRVKLPDNITSWKTYFLFMGKHWLHGMDSSLLKVYKPLQTVTIIPSYFYKGDECEVKSKFMNLTAGAKSISTYASINGKEAWKRNVSVENTYVDSTLVKGVTTDSLIFESGLIFEKNYKDAEQYHLPVYSPAMVYHKNQAVLMDQDSTYVLQFNEGTKGEVIFNNNLMEKIMAVVNEIQDYEYGCVEQSASKLNALLLKNTIQRVLKQKPDNPKAIQHLISQLTDMQNRDGSFGWWKNNGTSDRMTIYAMEVAAKALHYGYGNNIYSSATNYVKQHFDEMSTSDKLYAFFVLKSNNDVPAQLVNYSTTVKVEDLNTTDKLFYYQVLRMVSPETVKETDVYALFLEMNRNIARPYQDNFFYDYRADLFKAYTLFKGSSFEKQFVDLFKKKLINGQLEGNLNTFSKVALMEAMTTSAVSDTSKPIYSFLTINDTIKVKSYPYRLPIQGTSCSVKHTGGDVFMNSSEKQISENPERHDSVFALRNYFVQNGKQGDLSSLTNGKECVYNIDLTCFKKGEHVMIEVPIPSGMKVKNKVTNYSNGDYVEYFKHKVVYYFANLPMGTHQMQIQLMPVFKGSFTLAPVKCSLMYYPYVYGNTKMGKVEIK